MSIYHLSGKIISRSQGRSSVAAAAYRAAEKLIDERTGLTHDFSKKEKDVFFKEILLPKDAPDWMSDRGVLWNHVESVEKRKDAQLSREFTIALPKELTDEQNIVLAREFVQKQFVDRGMVADVCLHYGHQKDEKQPHIHVMLSLREVTKEGFGKKVRAWNRKELLLGYREAWAEYCNHHLALHGHDLRIDHRTLEAQGIDLEPQNKIGSKEAQARLAKLAEHQDIARGNGERLLADPNIAFDAISLQQSTFTQRDLARFAHRHSSDKAQFEQVFAALKTSSLLVSLGKDARGQARFSTREMVALERGLINDAQTLSSQYQHSVNLSVQANVKKSYSLNEEQTQGFNNLIREGDIACLIGFAGSGKSRLLGAASLAWQKEGFQVQGMALSGIAAEGLASSAAIDSCTIASRLYRWDKGIETLCERDIVILDEAGMVGSRQMARVLSYVKSAGAKLVLAGDPEQLQAIDAGASFRAIVQQVGATRLVQVIRQREVWQQEATQQLALGYTTQALSCYQQADHIHEYPTQTAAMEAMVEHWQETRSNHPNKRLIMLAYTRDAVYALNQQARQARCDNGELAVGEPFQTERGERYFAPGDVVYFLRNDYLKLQVKNGTLGVISQVKDQQLQVDLYGEGGQSKRQVQVNIAHYPYIDHGYAATVHKAQGVTVDRSFVLASTYFDRHISYVAMSRHREGAELYWGKDTFSSFDAMTRELSRAQHKEFSVDYSTGV